MAGNALCLVISISASGRFRPISREGAIDSTPTAPLCWLPERLRAALRLNSELVVDGATQPLLASEVSFGRLNRNLVVDGATQPLLASEVSFGRLNRNVPEQELNLVEYSAGKMA